MQHTNQYSIALSVTAALKVPQQFLLLKAITNRTALAALWDLYHNRYSTHGSHDIDLHTLMSRYAFVKAEDAIPTSLEVE